jgi:hypothetical protein
VNTYTHHHAGVRGASRAERNAWRVVSGGIDKLDNGTWETLSKVLS